MISIPALLLFLIGPLAPAQNADPASAPHAKPSRSTLESLRRSRMHYDERDDGTVWAAGADYKVGFTADGVRYVPALGSQQQRNQPLSLSPVSMSVAGEPIRFERGVTPERVENRISFARGGCSERYDLQPLALEQSFEFQTLPARGELVVRIPVSTTMTGSSDSEGLTFLAENGRVTYSRAVAIDARGRRADAQTDLVDGEIVIRVDAAFVTAAELPLVVDPIVTTFPGFTSPSDGLSADCVWNPVSDTWFFVYQTAQSAGDYDIFALALDATGTSVFSASVELSEGSWTNPRCAALPSSNVFLVVAEVAAVSPKIVVARRVNQHIFGGISADPTLINVGGSIAGDLTAPDVGGDPYPGTPAYFCVVFTHALGGLEKEIGYRLVSPSGTLIGTGPTYFAHAAGTSEAGASISTSNDANFWTIAWQRSDPITPTISGIWAARLNWNGALAAAPFLVADSGLLERAPSVSSPLPGTNRMVIAYRQSSSTSGQGDIGLTALDGTTVLSSANLTALEAAGTQALDQQNPTVETDGQHFLVIYPEFESAAAHYDLYVSQVLLSGTQLSVYDGHGLVHNGPGSVRRGRVAGKLGDTGPTRYFAVFDTEITPTNHDVGYAFIDTLAPGSDNLFCYGDGTGTPCPCANSGAATHGCAHSASSIGGWLLKTAGTASVSIDTAQIQVGNVPPGAPCLFFQGTTQSAGSPFGDGLLCASGTITRLAVAFAVGVTATCPSGVGTLGGVPASGGMRTYQAWYRDSSSSFCSASTFNLSNGLALYWAP